MLSELYKKSFCPVVKGCSPSYTKLTRLNSVSNGVVSSKSEFKEFNTHEHNKQFSYTDFSIANIIACGADSQLKPVHLGVQSLDNLISGFERLNSHENVNPQES